MKKHGKGPAMHVKGVPKRSRFLANVAEGCAVVPWQPLRRWPAKPHYRQAELDTFSALPSRFYQSEDQC